MRILFHLTTLLTMNALSMDPRAQPDGLHRTPAKSEIIPIVGRVIAWKEPLHFEAGNGGNYIVFIFAVEPKRNLGKQIVPVMVVYEFLKSEGALPDSFFDYSKRYELQVFRYPGCDDNVSAFSYEHNADTPANPLPPNYLQLLAGVPKNVLKPDGVLPCYILFPGKYKVLNQRGTR